METIKNKLTRVENHLKNLHFAYNTINVTYNADIGYHVIFTESVKDKITESVEDYLKENNFTYSFKK